MVTASCPSRQTLLQYSIGMLSDEQSDGLAGHLDSCPDCQATIVTLEDAEDTLIGRLRMPMGSESCLAEPEFQAALAQAIATPRGTSQPSRTGVSPVLPGDEGDSAPAMPHTLGEYQILEELGHGGMGRVYRALHTKLDRVVAVKVLPRGRMEDPQAIARFEREMRAVGQLAHPNIVQAYDAREIDGTPVLIMEFVDGLDLAELVRRIGPLPVADACELVRQAALGLQRAHEHGLVHRDIKPSNLMLALSGQPSVSGHQRPAVGDSAPRPSSVAPPQVKILDLGLALLKADEPAGEGATDSEGGTGVSAVPPVATAPGEELTGAQQIMGTVSYMAPEQAGDAHQVDIRADIYSLGCTLYKLLSGRAPFRATSTGRCSTRCWPAAPSRSIPSGTSGRRFQRNSPRCWIGCWPRTRPTASPPRRRSPRPWNLSPPAATSQASSPIHPVTSRPPPAARHPPPLTSAASPSPQPALQQSWPSRLS